MAEAVVLVGTKKGLWVGRSDERRQEWEWSEPQLLMQGIYGTCIDTRGDRRGCSSAAPASTGVLASTAPTTSARPGPRPRAQPCGSPRTGQQRGAGLADPARPAGRARRGLRRHRAVGAVPVRGRRRDVRAGARAVGPPAPRAVGRRLRRPGDPHGAAAPRPTRRRSWWRCRPAASTAPPTAARPGSRPTRGIKAYFFPDPWPEFGQCVHKVAAHPADARADLRAEPPRRLPLRRRRATAGRRSPTGCRATSGSRWSSTRTGPAWSTSSRWWPTASGSRPTAGAGSAAPTTPARPGSPVGRGCPTGFYAAVLRDAMCADDADPAGVYFGTRDGEVYASPDEGESWPQVAAHLPDVLCVRAAVV